MSKSLNRLKALYFILTLQNSVFATFKCTIGLTTEGTEKLPDGTLQSKTDWCASNCVRLEVEEITGPNGNLRE